MILLLVLSVLNIIFSLINLWASWFDNDRRGSFGNLSALIGWTVVIVIILGEGLLK